MYLKVGSSTGLYRIMLTKYMPYRDGFSNEQSYHIVLRALDDNLLFKDRDDWYRGVFSIYEFNNSAPVDINWRRRQRALFKKRLNSRRSASLEEEDKRKKLVLVEAFCLMPNHVHLLLRQIQPNGISRFMQKFGGGFAKYFNIKYQRKGHVFQGRFLDVPITDTGHLQVILTYIHTNPIALIEPKWKELGIRDYQRAGKFIEEYKWSSHQDYLDQQNFPSVTDRKDALEEIGGVENYVSSINAWISEKAELRKLVMRVEKDLIESERKRLNSRRSTY